MIQIADRHRQTDRQRYTISASHNVQIVFIILSKMGTTNPFTLLEKELEQVIAVQLL